MSAIRQTTFGQAKENAERQSSGGGGGGFLTWADGDRTKLVVLSEPVDWEEIFIPGSGSVLYDKDRHRERPRTRYAVYASVIDATDMDLVPDGKPAAYLWPMSATVMARLAYLIGEGAKLGETVFTVTRVGKDKSTTYQVDPSGPLNAQQVQYMRDLVASRPPLAEEVETVLFSGTAASRPFEDKKEQKDAWGSPPASASFSDDEIPF